MGLLERGGILRDSKSWTAKAKQADIERKCPRPPAATPLAAPAPKKAKKDTWPNKKGGKYEPGKGKKQRGR